MGGVDVGGGWGREGCGGSRCRGRVGAGGVWGE